MVVLVIVDTDVEKRVVIDVLVDSSVLARVPREVAELSSVLMRVSRDAAPEAPTALAAGIGGAPFPTNKRVQFVDVSEVNRPLITSPPTAVKVKTVPPSFTITTVPEPTGENQAATSGSIGKANVVELSPDA